MLMEVGLLSNLRRGHSEDQEGPVTFLVKDLLRDLDGALIVESMDIGLVIAKTVTGKTSVIDAVTEVISRKIVRIVPRKSNMEEVIPGHRLHVVAEV
jgi:hypothetical protein